MKTKLLKKVRKRFVIEHRPYLDHKCKYIITDLEDKYYLMSACGIRRSHISFEEALTALRSFIRKIYYKHSKQYKLSKNSNKLWPNVK